jgi:hypothetical protein
MKTNCCKKVEFHEKYEFVPKRNVIPFVGNHLHHPQVSQLKQQG